MRKQLRLVKSARLEYTKPATEITYLEYVHTRKSVFIDAESDVTTFSGLTS